MSKEKELLLKKFKISLINFIDQLNEQYPNVSDLKFMKIFIKTTVPIGEVIDNFYKYTVPHKQKIINKNEAFFMEKDDVFSFLTSDKTSLIKTLWKDADDDTKNIIWQWFEHLITISEQYYK
jgi:hypothetical protein